MVYKLNYGLVTLNLRSINKFYILKNDMMFSKIILSLKFKNPRSQI